MPPDPESRRPLREQRPGSSGIAETEGTDRGASLTPPPAADQYYARANRHRPDQDGLRAEAQRLHREGLRPADIAQALRVPLDQVLNWLAAGVQP